MKTTKYAIVTIKEQCGEYEFTGNTLVKGIDEKDIENKSDDIARNWRGGGDEDYDGYSVDGGMVIVSVRDIKLISKEHYKFLKDNDYICEI